MNVYNLIMLIIEQQVGTRNGVLSIELVMSIIAILISIGSVIFEYVWNKKINKTNLEAEFIKDIYAEYLIEKIPKARDVILYSNHILADTDDLINVLNDIRQASLFFKYKDRRYYDILYIKLQNLEDKLVIKAGKITEDEYIEFIKEVNKDIEEIYNVIMKKYVGKRL